MEISFRTEASLVESRSANPWYRRPLKKDQFAHSSHNLSFDLKISSLKASTSVVGICSHLGEEKIFRASGFVVESIAAGDKFVNTILTTASILRCKAYIDDVADGIKISVMLCDGKKAEADIVGYDFHYNIAAIKIETDVPIATARLRHVDDSVSIEPNLLDERLPKFYHDKFILVPGDTVLALGRYHTKKNGLMVVAGQYSVNKTGLDCQELSRVEFEIPWHGVGGPLINCYGEVIGINFYRALFTPFLPINIVSMWWEQFKKKGHCLLPRLGVQMGNLYMREAAYLETVIQRFPNICKGVVVYEATSESPAFAAGILPRDIIVECDGKFVGSALEFFELIWDKVGQPVHLAVLRPSDGSRRDVTIVIGSVDPNQSNRWPFPEKRGRVRH